MSEIKLMPEYDESLQERLRSSIQGWHTEAAKLLPTLPANIDIEFDNNYLIPGFGTGGASWDLHTMKLAYDPSFDATEEDLLAELKATYFHEGYHLSRGFSFMTTPNNFPAIKNAIEEGAATKFEVVHANSSPGYEKYKNRETMLQWLDEVKGLPDGFDYDWQRWKFFDPETGRKWILYKVGIFIIDEALMKKPDLTITNMSTLDCEEILKLSKL